jgi:hypothetical protein
VWLHERMVRYDSSPPVIPVELPGPHEVEYSLDYSDEGWRSHDAEVDARIALEAYGLTVLTTRPRGDWS